MMISAIEVNVLALIMCAGIYIRIRKYKLEVIGTKRFLQMYFLMVLVLSAEVLELICEAKVFGTGLYYIQMFLNGFYFVGQTVLPYILLLFNFDIQGVNLNKKIKAVASIPACFVVVVAIINMFNPFAFTIGAECNYYRLGGYLWITAPAFTYVFLDVLVALIGHIKNRGNKIMRYCLYFNISIVIAGIISFAMYGTELFPMIATCLLFLFLSISDKRNSEIDEDACTDSLTGLLNTKAYQKKIGDLEEYDLCKKTCNYAVVVMDVNNLKITNDQLGHAIGNKLIFAAAECMTECFKDCSIFRIGGDEFVVIIEGEQFDSRQKMFDDFVKKANSYEIETDKGMIYLKVAAGMADFISGKNLSYIESFRMADKAMYENKYMMKKEIINAF